MDIGPLLSIIALALGVAGGYYVANRKYQALVSVSTAFFEEIQVYWKITADGVVTLDEENEVGKAAVRFFDRLAKLNVVLKE